MGLRIYGIGIGNYRSFCSDDMARIGPCEKVHVLTGQNNTGKSSLLQAYQRLMGMLRCHKTGTLGSGSYFNESDLPVQSLKNQFEVSVCFSVTEVLDWIDSLLPHVDASEIEARAAVKKLLTADGYSDVDDEYCWIDIRVERKNSNVFLWVTPNVMQFEEALSEMNDSTKEEILGAMESLVACIGNEKGKSLTSYEAIVQAILHDTDSPEVVLVPAIRRIQKVVEDVPSARLHPSGVGFPEKLLRLTNHSAKSHEDAMGCIRRFEELIRQVLNEPDMSYSVDYDTHEVSFQTEGSPMLPITELGTGIEELLVLALMVATTHDSIICIEEPEIHLHPTLIRRLVDCLQRDESGNRFILATHSPTLINAPGVSVTHVTKRGGVSCARTISGIVEGRDVLDDIGVQASDILLSNYVVWVEGPSDRIYVNAWIHELDPSLKEVMHYTIVTYGGSLLSGFTASSDEEREVEKLIRLVRVNSHFCVLMDSDVTSFDGAINNTKQRIIDECKRSENLSWVTWGATIENYYPGERISAALQELYPSESYNHELDDPLVHPLSFTFCDKNTKGPDKVKVAHRLTEDSILNCDSRNTGLRDNVSRLVEQIRKASHLV